MGFPPNQRVEDMTAIKLPHRQQIHRGDENSNPARESNPVVIQSNRATLRCGAVNGGNHPLND